MDGLLARMVAEAAQLLLQDDVCGSKRQAAMPTKSEIHCGSSTYVLFLGAKSQLKQLAIC